MGYGGMYKGKGRGEEEGRRGGEGIKYCCGGGIGRKGWVGGRGVNGTQKIKR